MKAMKAIYQVLCLLLLFFVALSCENRDSIDIEKLDSSKENLGYVPVSTAKSAADLFISTHSKNENKAARVGKREVKETITVKDSVGVPSFYVINYENNEGFTIVSAEKKVNPILGYSDTGNFNLNNLDIGTNLWTNDLKKMINFIRKNKDATELKGASNQWSEYVKSGARTSYEPICTDCYSCENKIVDNFIFTTWGQREGYNGSCPGASGGPCNLALTGCVATSMMQVMRYYSRPFSNTDSYHIGGINWWNMPMAASGSCSLTFAEQEISAMMRSVGENVNMSYGATSSGAYPWKVAQSLKNDYGYASSTDRSNYNSSTVMSELDVAKPVILDGGSHMWVTSGYQYLNTEDCTQAFLYLYMNWGWSGLNNGFYSFNNWTTTVGSVTYDFNSNKHMTLVRP
jgi:hypothetical protein